MSDLPIGGARTLQAAEVRQGGNAQVSASAPALSETSGSTALWAQVQADLAAGEPLPLEHWASLSTDSGSTAVTEEIDLSSLTTENISTEAGATSTLPSMQTVPPSSLLAWRMQSAEEQGRAQQVADDGASGFGVDAKDDVVSGLQTASADVSRQPTPVRAQPAESGAVSAPPTFFSAAAQSPVSMDLNVPWMHIPSKSQPMTESLSTRDVAVPTSSSPAQSMVQMLASRLQVQHLQGVDTVTVRLDPPQWGQLEIRIQQDAAGLQVHLQASHAEVGRQLAQMADALRQELQWRTPGEATVTVATGRGTAGQQQSSQQQDDAQQQPSFIGEALLWDEIPQA